MSCEWQTDTLPAINVPRLTPRANAPVYLENTNGSTPWCTFVSIASNNPYAKCSFPNNQEQCPFYTPTSESHSNNPWD